jgi:DNA-binding response OmpR family regulator
MSFLPAHVHHGAYIVVANEKPALLDMMVDALGAADHRVFRASDGLAAFELALALHNLDLLITDTEMPGLNGPDLIRHVRVQLPTLPILYIQNQEHPPRRPEGLPTVVPTLREPFTAEQLLAAVESLLDRTRRFA